MRVRLAPGRERHDVAAVLLDVVYVLQLEPELCLEYVSDPVEEFLGYSAAELLTDPRLWEHVLDPRDRDRMLVALNAEIGVTTHLTVRLIGKDQRVMWSQQTSRRIRREDGSVAVYGALNHITSRQVTEARAGIDPRRLAEDVSDVVLQTDLDGRIVWVSESVETLTGWKPQDLVGAIGRELVDEQELELAQSVRADALRGRSRSGVVFRIPTASGDHRFISVIARPARDAEGVVEGVIIGWRDVDEVMRARLAAESERQILRATLDTLPDPQVLVEAVRREDGTVGDFCFMEANPAACQALGHPRERIVGALLSQVDPPLHASRIVARLAATLDGGKPQVINNHPHTHSTGQVRRYDIRAVAVRDALTVTWRDVTERFEEAASLAQSEARYRLILEESSDMVSFHEPQGHVQWVSPAIERLLGWAPTDVGGDRLLELIHRDDGPAIAETRDRLLAGAESASTRFRMRTTDGAFRWLEATARAVRDEDQTVLSLVVVTHDIQSQMDYEEALAQSRQRYRLLAENATDVVYRASPDAVLEWVSEGVEAVLGFTPGELVGCSVKDLASPEDRDFVGHAIAESLAGNRRSARLRLFTKPGGTRWVDVTIHPVLDDAGRPSGFVGGWRDIETEVATETALDQRARTDDLTGLLNRREVMAEMAERLSPDGAARQPFAVAFCDLDDFKTINDTMGHAVGDRLLQIVADRIRECLRASDKVARVGGDEMLLLLDGVGELNSAVAVAEKVRQAVASPVQINGYQVPGSVSIGVTLADEHDDVDALAARADRAMYRAKQAGRNRVVGTD